MATPTTANVVPERNKLTSHELKESMKKEVQGSEIYKMAHGCADECIASQFDLVLSGKDKNYAKLWETVQVEPNNSQSIGATEPILKSLYSPTNGRGFVVINIVSC
jgi:hypothetical protein